MLVPSLPAECLLVCPVFHGTRVCPCMQLTYSTSPLLTQTKQIPYQNRDFLLWLYPYLEQPKEILWDPEEVFQNPNYVVLTSRIKSILNIWCCQQDYPSRIVIPLFNCMEILTTSSIAPTIDRLFFNMYWLLDRSPELWIDANRLSNFFRHFAALSITTEACTLMLCPDHPCLCW